jgi:hypothetical protein
VVEIDKRIAGPKFAADVFAADDTTGVSQEQNQQLEWLSLKANLAAFFAEFARADVYQIPVESNDLAIDG